MAVEYLEEGFVGKSFNWCNSASLCCYARNRECSAHCIEHQVRTLNPFLTCLFVVRCINVFRLSFNDFPFFNIIVYRRPLRFVEQAANYRIDFGDNNAWGKQSTESSLTTTIWRGSTLRIRQFDTTEKRSS